MNNQTQTPDLPSYLRPELIDDALAAIALWDVETALLQRRHRANSVNDDDDVNTSDYQEAA